MEQAQKPIVSVVIIAFNDEAHIEDAVGSARAQTERNIEILCVDDGSGDGTAERMLRCAEEDERIRVIRQPNRGGFAARYAGLLQAAAGYVLFLDSDDVLRPDAVRTAVSAAEAAGADVLEFGVSPVVNPGDPPTEDALRSYEAYYSQSVSLPPEDHGPALIDACFDTRAITWNVWNKLYKTELLRKALRFYRGEWMSMTEDMLATLMVLCHAERYARIPDRLYEYRIGGGLSTSAGKISSPAAVKAMGMQWLVLKTAYRWLDEAGYPKEKIEHGMEAFDREIRVRGVLHNLAVRVAPDRREEFMGWLRQCGTEEEIIGLLRDGLACMGEENERLSAIADDRLASIRRLSEDYETISNAFFWKITKPARAALDLLKWLAGRHAEENLLRKGLRSLRENGILFTYWKAVQKIRTARGFEKIARKPLFTESELAGQREHRFSEKLRFSVVTPLYNTPEPFLREMIESVIAQTYGDWELCLADGSGLEHAYVGEVCREYAEKDRRVRYRKLERNLGISGNTNACLEMAGGAYVVLLDHDDLLHPAALHEVAKAVSELGADFVYTDECTFRGDTKHVFNPHFKPDYAPDTLRANNYICHLTAFRRSLLDEAGLFDPACDGSQDHDMVLRLTEKAERVAHIPEILYYWRAHAGSVAGNADEKPYAAAAGIRSVEKYLRRTGQRGMVTSVRPGLTIYRIRFEIAGTPKVSILIPNHEHMEDLRTCLDSVFRKTTWPNYEVVVVENNSTSPGIFDYYRLLEKEHANLRVVTWDGPFNYPDVNNFGAKHCTGEYILLLNNDTEVITPGWIEEMLMFAQREDVGAVGAMLYYRGDRIQHAGVTLGLGGVAGHRFYQADRAQVGYMGRLLYAQDLSAVTAACMLMRRGVWEEMGGLDREFAVAYNDVDLCMRVRKAGYLIVWTPFAELYHEESKNRGADDTPEKQRRFRSEVDLFKRRWWKELESGDPYYNPNLSLSDPNCGLAPRLEKHAAR